LHVLAFCAAAIVATWPLILHPARTIAGGLGDPLLNTFILAWDADRARHLQCDLRGNRQTDQGTAGRSAAVEGLERKQSCLGPGKLDVQHIDSPSCHSAAEAAKHLTQFYRD